MTPPQDLSELRRNQILEAATSVFASLGFHKARMEDVAVEAGLSKGTLYLYFESKDHLFRALIGHFYQRAASPLREMVEAREPVSERLLFITRATAAEIQQISPALPLIYEFYAAASHGDAARQFLKDFFAENRKLLAALIQEGVDGDEFRQVDVQAAALLLSATLEGLALLWMIDPESVDLKKHSETCLGLILDGLRR